MKHANEEAPSLSLGLQATGWRGEVLNERQTGKQKQAD
jgi:hypothetical protein